MLLNLIKLFVQTVDLFDNINIEYDLLLPTIEQIKHKYGKFAIGLAVTQLSDTWKMRNNHISKSYTSNLDDIILAK